MNPATAAYMLVPHMNLSPEIRQRVILEEMAEGHPVWSDMIATLNGQEITISACREWGAFLLGGRMIVLPHYPLQEPEHSTSRCGCGRHGRRSRTSGTADRGEEDHCEIPCHEKEGDSRISFAPVQRVHRLDTGELTELVDIHFNLNDKLRQDLGDMNIGDEKEFSLTVRVLTGFRPPQEDIPI